MKTPTVTRYYSQDHQRLDDLFHRFQDAHPEVTLPILSAAARGRVTLVFGASDVDHNNAVALRDYLEARYAETARLPI